VRIALDYDNTFTADPKAWTEFIHLMQREGHVVYCVTMRYPPEHPKFGGETRDVQRALGHLVDGLFCTGRQAKEKFMLERGIKIDVWVDDTPGWILQDAADVE
jgi:hypothetical protein